MKPRIIGYWICTALIAFVFLSGGVADLLRPASVMEGMAHLGYPAYFALVLGFWKVAGGATVLVPGFPLVKEWAYAGMIFDLSGAMVSHASSGDDIFHIAAPVVIAGLVAASWALRPESRRLKLA